MKFETAPITDKAGIQSVEGIKGTSLIKRTLNGVEIAPIFCPRPFMALRQLVKIAKAEALKSGYSEVCVGGKTYATR